MFRPMLARTLIDLVDSSRFSPCTRVCQRPRIFGLIFRRIVLEDCRKFFVKVLPVQSVVEVSCEKVLERLKYARSDRSLSGGASAKPPTPSRPHRPEHLINDIDGLYQRRRLGRKAHRRRRIFSFENRRRPEETIMTDATWIPDD